MSEELKPCPFCGGEAKAFFCEESGTYDVQCQQCGALPFLGRKRGSGRFKSMDDVIAAWNRRAGSTCEQRRTCRVVRSGEPSPTGVPRERRCSECGGMLTRFGAYCHNCGARVVE